MLNVVYDPFLKSKKYKTTISEKNSFMTPFFTLFVLSPASDNTTSQNIGGNGCMGLPPPKILGGPSPSPPPPRSPPLVVAKLLTGQYMLQNGVGTGWIIDHGFFSLRLNAEFPCLSIKISGLFCKANVINLNSMQHHYVSIPLYTKMSNKAFELVMKIKKCFL